MAATDRTALVLYASETGNAQDMAEEVGRLCQRLHFKTDVEEMDGVDLNALLRYQFVVFVVSTTGQGDMPYNGLVFWRKLLRKRLPPGCLSQLRYTCFGLGDSTYVKFNWAARKLVRRLDQLGAATFIDGFEADEQFPDGIDGSFVRWADGLYQYLSEQYPLADGLEPIPDDVILPPKWSLQPALAKLNHTNGETIPGSPIDAASEPVLSGPAPDTLLPVPDGWTATLVENKRLTPESHWQDVRHVSFDIPSRGPDEKLRCNPGDCLTLYPKNFPVDAEKLIALMGWHHLADSPLDLTACAALPRNLYVPPSCTLRDLLLHNVDITAIPRRSFLKSMAYFSTDPYHVERLLEFNKTEYLDEYFDYATRARRSIIEVLEEFTSVQIPAERLLDVFPLIRGRDFSIANGGAMLNHPTRDDVTRVELLVALVKYRTVLRKPREGLCSRYLDHLPPGTRLSVSVKPVITPIHGPQRATKPLVAIATGTGLAPVRALVHERLTHPGPPAPMLLFFGNRSAAADYFFANEWAALGERLAVFTAFSRDQRQKIYVQDRLREQAPLLADLISQNAIFCVCGGSTKMADAAKLAVFDPFLKGGELQTRQKLLDDVTWWQEIW